MEKKIKEVVNMELNIREPENIEELRKMIKDIDSIPEDFSIRIENNIFSIDGNWLLQKNEDDLENINVLLKEDEEDDNDTKNFRSEVRKTTEDFEGRMDVDIKKFLYAR